MKTLPCVAVLTNTAGLYSPEHKKINGQTGPWQENRPIEEMLEDYKGFNNKCVNLMKAIPNPSIWGIL